MERINTMFLFLATFVVAFVLATGCVPAGSPLIPDGGVLVGACPHQGDTNPCLNASGCEGIQVCGYTSLPGGGHGTDLHWGQCTGPTSCATPVDSGTPSPDGSVAMTDAGAPAMDAGDDAGTMSVDAGSDAGMMGADAGPACDPTIVRTCMTACGVPGAIGFLLDSCDPSSPCVRDLTSLTGGCTTVTPTECPPPDGVSGGFLLVCLTVCDASGIESWRDYCDGQPCYAIFPESCAAADAGVPMTDAGIDAGTDAGDDAGMMSVDAGFDAGVDAGTDSGVAAVDAGFDAGTDAGPPPVDAGTDSGIADAGSSGSDSGSTPVVPADVPASGVYIRLDDTSSAHWCPGTGTVEPWCWDNTGTIPSEWEHFGPPQLTVPVSPTDIELTASIINNTVNCRSGPKWASIGLAQDA